MAIKSKENICFNKNKAIGPLGLWIVVTALVFSAEIAVMFILSYMPPYAILGEAILDSAILTLIICPLLYFLLFRPMLTNITYLSIAEEKLSKSHKELDLKVRKRTSELEMANRLIRMHNEGDQALIHATEEIEFLHVICRILVEGGEYSLAWIGYAEDDEHHTVRHMASAWSNKDDLEKTNTSWADTEKEHNPTEKAIRTGKPVIISDMNSDSRYEPWRNDAMKRGFMSSVALPLLSGEKVFGVLNIFASRPFAFDGNEVRLLSEFVQDISTGTMVLKTRAEHKRAEKALAESEARYRMLHASAFDAIILANSTGTIIECNKSAESIFGYETGEMIGLELTSLMPEHLRERHSRAFNHCLNTGETNAHGRVLELEGLGKGGRNFSIEIIISSFIMDGKKFFTGTIRDITERKKAEEKLRHSEDKYRNLFDNASDAIYLIDPMTKKILDCNKKASEMDGYSIEELKRMTADQLHPTDELEHLADQFKEVQTVGEGFNITGMHHERKDGVKVPIDVNATMVTMGSEQMNLSIVRDITELKQAVEILHKSEEKYRSLFEKSQDPIIIMDSNKRILDTNQAAVDLLNYTSRKELVTGNMLWDLFLDPNDINECVKALNVYNSIKNHKVSFKTKQGKPIDISISISVINSDNDDTVTYQNILRDMTEHNRLERQLVQSQKMEAVGQLTGGIAHDFNNILTAIFGYGNLLQTSITGDKQNDFYIDKLLLSAKKAAVLTQSLLAFSRRQVFELNPVGLKDCITDIEQLLLRLIGEDIDFQTSLTSEDPVVIADKGQIEQVLMNLITNARHAMPEGGTLRVSVESTLLDSDFIMKHKFGDPGVRYAMLAIADTGHGIEPKNLEKIFEPFFTTKEVGVGTGLGLSMVYGIIKQHNGYIVVESTVGHGTVFKIYLPIVEHVLDDTTEEQATPEPPPSGNETILLVEDDMEVRELARLVLEESGYNVIEALDGMDALSKFNRNKEKIQLLLLDVIMPKMNGMATHEEILKIRPDMKSIFISGYTDDIISQQGLLDEELNIIRKPVSPTALLKKIREVLDRRT